MGRLWGWAAGWAAAAVLTGCALGPPPPPPTADERAILVKTYTRPEARCDLQTAQHVLALGLTPEQVKRVSIFEEDVRPFPSSRWLDPQGRRRLRGVDDRPEAWIIGHRAWVELHRCRGELVLRFSTACQLQQAYTTGDCVVEGLP